MKSRPPFNILELVIAIVLVGSLAASIIYAIDPVQKAKKDRDELTKETAKSVIEATAKYSTKTGKPQASLPWTPVQDPKFGLDLVIAEGLIPSAVKSENFVASADPKEWVYVGANAKADRLYACFIPESRVFRVDHIALSSLTSGEALPVSGRPNFCPQDPDWTSTFCYYCISQKL